MLKSGEGNAATNALVPSAAPWLSSSEEARALYEIICIEPGFSRKSYDGVFQKGAN